MGFRLDREVEDLPKVKMVRARDEESLTSSDDSGPPPLEPLSPHESSEVCALEDEGQIDDLSDEQPDSVTPIVGWDFSKGDSLNTPAHNLEEADLYQYLDDRDVAWLYKQLYALGVEVPALSQEFLRGVPDASCVGYIPKGQLDLTVLTSRR